MPAGRLLFRRPVISSSYSNSVGVPDITNWRSDVGLPAREAAALLLPESPSGALEAFEDARRKGLTGPLLAANIALAYLQLGRADLALQECQHAAEGGLKPGGSAWLWELDDHLGLQARLTMMDPTKYLGLVALRSASALDDAEAIEWWRSFAEVPDVIDQREGT